MIDIVVTEVSDSWIKGKIGHASVMIPRVRMPENECEYRPNENIYVISSGLKVDKDSKIRCKVAEISIELSTIEVR